MLCLSRRIGERIVIGNGITVQVLQINGGIVRLGVVAPEGVTIDREEIRERKQKEPRHGL
ncbi:carbon storage regulator [Pseudomonas sp. CK-NBRI-02]|uniref:carbon storage regulator n=1 Tax=Pseudomonas sp. CK-NBRI-02 TaxID=2249759 RepID=UPI00039CD122|nr:carbon storage regulator [Pseudomonas sp. CK-NBRI-02]TYO83688.1 carbon storage regulator [Pseudomonas sp. CK-NBRI-02]